MKENINEHDKTKQMMNIMRGGFKSIINEEDTMGNPGQEQMQPEVDGEEPEATKSPVKGGALWKEELEGLQTIDKRVRIDNFKIYPQNEDVLLEGTFLPKPDINAGVKFKMTLLGSNPELIPSSENIVLETNLVSLLGKLIGYYKNWTEEWAVEDLNDVDEN
jgi:hypothetical protein